MPVYLSRKKIPEVKLLEQRMYTWIIILYCKTDEDKHIGCEQVCPMLLTPFFLELYILNLGVRLFQNDTFIAFFDFHSSFGLFSICVSRCLEMI